MSLSIPGLASGLDSTSLVNSIMQVETVPQNILKNKVSAATSRATDLKLLNSKLQAVHDLVKSKVATGTFTTMAASADSSAVSVATTTGTAAASLTFTVDRLAQSQVSVTKAMSEFAGSKLTFVGSDGTRTEVNATSSKISDVVTAINKSNAGVLASAIPAGKDGSGTQLYRIQMTSKDTGAASAFSAYSGSSADIDAGTATNLLAEPSAATYRTAQDAQLTLWGGTDAQQTVTSASNKFTGLLTGVDVTVNSMPALTNGTPTPVTVNVTSSESSTTADVKTLTDAISAALSFIKSQSASSKSTNSAGDTITKLGTFTGDTTIRSAAQQVVSAVQDPINGVSPSTIGISFDRYGALTFDATAFAAALAKDPAKVDSMLGTIATRLNTTTDQLSNAYTGVITAQVTSQNTTIRTLNDQVSMWDDRLANRKAELTRQYQALESTLSTMKASGTYLTAQLDALSGASTKK